MLKAVTKKKLFTWYPQNKFPHYVNARDFVWRWSNVPCSCWQIVLFLGIQRILSLMYLVFYVYMFLENDLYCICKQKYMYCTCVLIVSLLFCWYLCWRQNEEEEPKGPIVKTLKSRHKGPVEDGVKTVDLGPLCRKLGLAWLMTDPRLWCVKDICGWVCAIFTWLLVLYAEYVVNFVMLIHNPNPTWSILNGIIFQFFAFMAVASHVRCMLTDPVSFLWVFNWNIKSSIFIYRNFEY